MKYILKIYQYEDSDVIERLFHIDELLTVKELFLYVMEGLDISNKTYIMEITEITEDGYELFSIFTIKTNDSGIEEMKVKS